MNIGVWRGEGRDRPADRENRPDCLMNRVMQSSMTKLVWRGEGRDRPADRGNRPDCLMNRVMQSSMNSCKVTRRRRHTHGGGLANVTPMTVE